MAANYSFRNFLPLFECFPAPSHALGIHLRPLLIFMAYGEGSPVRTDCSPTEH